MRRTPVKKKSPTPPNNFYDQFAEKWPSPFVARQSSGSFSGGILNPKTLANLDSQGRGPSGRIRVGRIVAYPVGSLIAWMANRTEVIEDTACASGEEVGDE